MSWMVGRFRTGTPASPAATGAAASDESGGQFRASDTPGVAIPLAPAPPRAPFGLGLEFPLSSILGNPIAIGLWYFDISGFGFPYADLSLRWANHDAVLVDPDGHCTIDGEGTLFEWVPYSRTIDGGDGILTPYIGLTYSDNDGSDRVVDTALAPVWSLIIDWRSLGMLQPSGDPLPAHDTSIPKPGAIPVAPQTIISNTHDNRWALYIPEQFADWVGGPGDWTLDPDPVTLRFEWSGGAGPPFHRIDTTDLAFTTQGPTLLEFDNIAQKVRMYGGTGAVLIGETDLLPAGAPGGFPPEPQPQSLGGGSLGPFFATFYVHINGYIRKMLIIGDSAINSIALLSTAGPLPGTEPSGMQGQEFRVAEPASAVASFTNSAHYWPLDDASSPLHDLIGGSDLVVVDPGSDATYETPGIFVPAAPTHTTALRLGGVIDGTGTAFATNAYIERGAGGTPLASLGPGGVGNDFTIACWIRWEGPIASRQLYPIFLSSKVPAPTIDETALDVHIGRAFAEPFGVGFDTWNDADATYDQLHTVELDWPAGFSAPVGRVSKLPTWALLTIVYRTIGLTVQKEIWIDGVLVAAQFADPGGWGADMHLAQVCGGTIATLQHLAIWPLALSPAEIAGYAGSRID